MPGTELLLSGHMGRLPNTSGSDFPGSTSAVRQAARGGDQENPGRDRAARQTAQTGGTSGAVPIPGHLAGLTTSWGQPSAPSPGGQGGRRNTRLGKHLSLAGVSSDASLRPFKLGLGRHFSRELLSRGRYYHPENTQQRTLLEVPLSVTKPPWCTHYKRSCQLTQFSPKGDFQVLHETRDSFD